MNIFLILIYLMQSLIPNVYAQTEAPEFKTLIFPHNLVPPYEIKEEFTFVNYYLNQSLTSENQLLKYFEEAQKHESTNNTDLAIHFYKKCVDFAFNEDWRNIHRQAIYLAHIKLSELDPTNQQEYFAKAIAFANEDTSLIHLQNKSIQNYKKSKPLIWNVNSYQKSFSHILLNGFIFDLAKTSQIQVFSGKHRITFLSAYHQPQTLYATLEQIPFIDPVAIPFVTGSCKNPQLSHSFLKIKNQVWFPDCKTEPSATHLKIATKNLNSRPQESLAESNLNSYLTSKTQSTPPPSKPLYKQPWFITTSLVVLGVLTYGYIQNKKNGADSAAPITVGEF